MRFRLILASYLLWVLVYPPFHLGWVAFMVLAPAFVATASLSRGQAFRWHFLAALAHNALMYWWIGKAVRVGQPILVISGVLLLVVFFSLLNGYLGVLVQWCMQKKWRLWLLPLAWAGFEMARTQGEMSLPWAHLGYSLGGADPLCRAAALLGVFGLSAVVVAANVWVAFCFLSGRRWRAGWALLAPFCLWLAGTASESPPPAAPRMADISLVQPAIDQAEKWSEEYFGAVMERTLRLVQSPATSGSELVILAETSVPAFLRRTPEIRGEFQYLARAMGADIVLGSLDYQENSHPVKKFLFYNSAFRFAASGPADPQQYSKMYLVPFSERLPFEGIFPLISYVNLGEGDFAAGPGPVIWGEKYRYSPTICYEVVYPEYIRALRGAGAEFLVNITNDGWFGHSAAPYQHLNICRFRALETGLPIARCANSGISALINGRGDVLAKTKLMEATVLRGKLPVVTLDPPYRHYGQAVEWGLFWIWVAVNVAALGSWWRRRRRGRGTLCH